MNPDSADHGLPAPSAPDAAAGCIHIRASKGWFDIPWREVFAHGELLRLLARRDVSVIYKQTVFGPAWFLIQPVLMALVFSVIFGRVAGLPTAGMPRILFYLGGLLVWNYFAGVVNGASGSFSSASALFSKVYFPRLVVPLSYPLSHLVFLGLNAVVFLLFYAWQVAVNGLALRPTWWILASPLLVLWLAAAGLGVGLSVAALTTKYRDLRFAMPFILQVWMFASPVIYPLDGVRDPLFVLVLRFNPVGVAVEAARYMLMGRGTVTWGAIGCGALVIAATLVFGLGAFNRAQRDFVDTI
jgi:lipopolysaccharide transport system permease protein